jgi:hypothetical protein
VISKSKFTECRRPARLSPGFERRKAHEEGADHDSEAAEFVGLRRCRERQGQSQNWQRAGCAADAGIR